ncbi:MAG: sigma-70 family RNA polymerase sigma factor [bacterium]
MTTDMFEARLIARFREGDARALEILFERHVDRAMGLAVRLTETREDAEEVTQEAFLRAFRQAHQFRGESETFSAWLFAIIRNLARDRRRQLRLPTLSLTSPEAERYPASNDAAGEAEKLMARRQLRQALDSLPEEWRTTLILCDIEEASHAEAALVLEKSVAATKSLLYRARRALRDRLADWEATS